MVGFCARFGVLGVVLSCKMFLRRSSCVNRIFALYFSTHST
jgi:hypothetical protein